LNDKSSLLYLLPLMPTMKDQRVAAGIVYSPHKHLAVYPKKLQQD